MKKSLIVVAALLVAVVIGVNEHKVSAQQAELQVKHGDVPAISVGKIKAQNTNLPPACVMLATETTYHLVTVTNDYGVSRYMQEDGSIVLYSVLSSNAPSGIVDGMNTADAIAIIVGAGLHPLGTIGYAQVFVRP